MFKRYIARNHLDPSSNNVISLQDLVKIFEGRVSSKGLRDSAYFVICCNGIDQLNQEGIIRVENLTNVVENVFDKSEWFGKFRVEGQSQIIIPGRYELLIDPQKKQIYLQATERAKYYGSGNLQLDKDLHARILRTDIGFEESRELVNSTCSSYKHGNTLQAWNI